jgi:uncharacterized protein YprB with RNaseH-like and TPR domain
LLKESFIHFPGVGDETERSLWGQGFVSWQHVLDKPEDFSCGSADRKLFLASVAASSRAIAKGNHRPFRKPLGSKHAWRAFPDFRGRCVYLDIETDGRSSGDAITTIGIYDGARFRCLVKHEDLADFPEIIADYGMIVTFYGAGFDLPMIQKRFPGLRLDHIHIDLCLALRQLGIRGGLKKIEKQLGIGRSQETDGLGGLDAIRLWRRYEQLDDGQALETLIAYNREDVVNLEELAVYAYDRLWSSTRYRLPFTG